MKQMLFLSTALACQFSGVDALTPYGAGFGRPDTIGSPWFSEEASTDAKRIAIGNLPRPSAPTRTESAVVHLFGMDRLCELRAGQQLEPGEQDTVDEYLHYYFSFRFKRYSPE